MSIFHVSEYFIVLMIFSILQPKQMPILHFTFIFDFISHYFYSQFLAFFHFTAPEICCFHFAGLLIFPVFQPKFEYFTLHIFKKSLVYGFTFYLLPPLYKGSCMTGYCHQVIERSRFPQNIDIPRYSTIFHLSHDWPIRSQEI